MKQLHYRDFEIEIAPNQGNRYPVAVLHSPSGQARNMMRLPFDPAALEQQLDALKKTDGAADSWPTQIVKQFGSQLFEALIHDEVRSIYDMSRQATIANGQGLRIKLRINTPELTTIPWEFLYDPRQGEFVALSRYTPIVRYIELPLPDPELAVVAPLRMLGMVANPVDTVPLNIDREKARLTNALCELQDNDLLELVWLKGQTWRDLQEAMQGGPWHIFHFVGHAATDDLAGESLLLLADDYGDTAPLSATQLGRLLVDHRPLRLAVLNTCESARGHEGNSFSSMASVLVQRGLPAVLAMQYEISDEAAIEFTTSFYSSLAANLPIDAATTEARKAISLAMDRSMEWGIPALFMRAPDGIIWRVGKEKIDMGTESDPYWWDSLPEAIVDFQAGDIDGDVVIASVGAGAQNVAIGKNITQAIYETMGEPTPDDGQIIQDGLAQVESALAEAEGQIGASAAKMAGGILAQIENELLKTGEDESPNAAIITQMGDLLLDSVPRITDALANLFATPAVGRVMGKAGETAVTWARRRFGSSAGSTR